MLGCLSPNMTFVYICKIDLTGGFSYQQSSGWLDAWSTSQHSHVGSLDIPTPSIALNI